MKRRSLFCLTITLAIFVLAACSSIQNGLPNTGMGTVSVDKTPIIIPPTLLQAVQTEVARGFNISSNQVQIISAQQVDWTNACLDLPKSGESCAQASTPGYRLIAIVNGKRYEVHTDTTGQNVRWTIDQGSPITP